MQRGCWHCENFYRFLFKVLTDDNFNDYFNNEEIFWRWLLTPDGLDSAYRCGIKFREFPRIGRGENYNKSFNSWLYDSYNLLTGLKIGIYWEQFVWEKPVKQGKPLARAEAEMKKK